MYTERCKDRNKRVNNNISLGYDKENITSNEGKWSRRGDIIDIFPVNHELPIKLNSSIT